MMPSISAVPTAGPAKRTMGAWLLGLVKNAWYAFALYLPVVLIVALALGTWWLARNTPSISMPTVDKPPSHEPDYFMRDFAVKSFDGKGQLATEVAGAEGRHFPDTGVLEIDKARVKSYKNSQLTTATANRAYSNADNSEVQLVGNAVVVREARKDAAGLVQPRLEFTGDFLHIFLNTEQVKSHKPVVITRGNDKFTADTLRYDNLDRVVEMQGRVKGTLYPQAKP